MVGPQKVNRDGSTCSDPRRREDPQSVAHRVEGVHRDGCIGAGNKNGDHGVVCASPYIHSALRMPRHPVIESRHRKHSKEAHAVKGCCSDKRCTVMERSSGSHECSTSACEIDGGNFMQATTKNGPGPAIIRNGGVCMTSWRVR